MIGLGVRHPAVLLLLAVLPLLYFIWRKWPPPLSALRSRISLVLRLLLALTLILALAGFRLRSRPDRRAVVAVVDMSASTLGLQETHAAAVRAIAGAKGPDDLFGVVTFGRDAQVEMSPTRFPVFDDFTTRPNPADSNLGAALRLAANIVPDGYARQLVLISDGRQNLGDAAAEIFSLKSQEVRVDILPAEAGAKNEVALAGIDVASAPRAGESVTPRVRIRSNVASKGKLTVVSNGTQVASEDIDIPAGGTERTIDLGALPEGQHQLRAEIQSDPDTYAANNSADAIVRVLGKPRVLVIEGTPGEGGNVVRALESADLAVESILPTKVPADPSKLAGHDAIVIVNAPVELFTPNAMKAIATAVRELGRGLIAIGGNASYGPGGWQGTALEEALPVRMEIPDRRKSPDVAVVIAAETMENPFGDVVALGAIQGVVDEITPRDELGFIAMGTDAGFVVPLGPISDKKATLDRIGAATLGDTPGYGTPMEIGIKALAASNAAEKHFLLIGDGDAIADIPNYGPIFEAAKAGQITISVIGVDTHFSPPYMSNMQDVARRGNGRFYLSQSASQVPDILLRASKTALRPWFEQTPFFPKVSAVGDLLSGVSLDAFPELGGYVVTTAKPAAEVYLSSPKDDPVLAATSYGLGRSVAWTTDVNGRWTSGFLRSPTSQSLLTRMVTWALPREGDEKIFLEASPTEDGFDVTVLGPEETSGGLEVKVVTPMLGSSNHPLQAAEPGRWRGKVPAQDPGVYMLKATLTGPAGQVAQAELPVVVPYSAEYLEVGKDETSLKLFAKAGGSVLSKPISAWDKPVTRMAVSAEMFWLLLLLFAIIWPLDVAIRRLLLTPRELASVFKALLTLKRPKELELIVPQSVARMRSRVQKTREKPK